MTNTAALVEQFAAAKAKLEAAKAEYDAIKDLIEEIGSDYIEGETVDLKIHLQVRRVLSEVALGKNLGITKEQVEACRVEGTPFSVIKIKAKTPA
jgi:hypothetical protein